MGCLHLRRVLLQRVLRRRHPTRLPARLPNRGSELPRTRGWRWSARETSTTASFKKSLRRDCRTTELSREVLLRTPPAARRSLTPCAVSSSPRSSGLTSPRDMTAQATLWSSCSSTPCPYRLRGAMTKSWPTGSHTPSRAPNCHSSATCRRTPSTPRPSSARSSLPTSRACMSVPTSTTTGAS